MFNTDLKIGQEQELILAKLLMDSGQYDNYELNDNADYDISMVSFSPSGETRTTFELKYDRYDNDRVAIEVFCLRRYEKSGLLKSKADYFVILKKGIYYLIQTKKLLGILKPEMFVIGGDGRSSVMALLDIKILEKYAKIKKMA
jgi:hypothetical protein